MSYPFPTDLADLVAEEMRRGGYPTEDDGWHHPRGCSGGVAIVGKRKIVAKLGELLPGWLYPLSRRVSAIVSGIFVIAFYIRYRQSSFNPCFSVLF